MLVIYIYTQLPLSLRKFLLFVWFLPLKIISLSLFTWHCALDLFVFVILPLDIFCDKFQSMDFKHTSTSTFMWCNQCVPPLCLYIQSDRSQAKFPLRQTHSVQFSLFIPHKTRIYNLVDIIQSMTGEIENALILTFLCSIPGYYRYYCTYHSILISLTSIGSFLSSVSSWLSHPDPKFIQSRCQPLLRSVSSVSLNTSIFHGTWLLIVAYLPSIM